MNKYVAAKLGILAAATLTAIAAYHVNGLLFWPAGALAYEYIRRDISERAAILTVRSLLLIHKEVEIEEASSDQSRVLDANLFASRTVN
jgi:hypothetical protein